MDIKIFDKYTRKTILTYIIIMVIFTMANSIFAPVFIPYMTSRGLSIFQANLVLSITMGTIFLLEIPTGVISDLVGRKMSFSISLILMIVAKLIFLFSFRLWSFCIAAVVDGIAFAFSSGSLEAWFVEKMKESGAKRYEGIFGYVGKWCMYGSIAAGFAGGFIVLKSYTYLWILSMVLLISCEFIVMKYVKEDVVKFNNNSFNFEAGLKAMKIICIDSLEMCKKNKILLFLLIISSLDALFLGGCFQLWSQYLPSVIKFKGVISSMWILLAFSTIIGNNIVQRIDWKNKDRLKIVVILNGFVAVAFILAGVIKNGWVIIIMFMLKNIITGIKRPMTNSIMNENIKDSNRSTIMSFFSQCNSLFLNIGLLTMGAIATEMGVPMSWLIGGILFISVIPIWWLMNKDISKTF